MLVGQSNFLSVTLVSVPTHRKRYTFFFNNIWQTIRKAFYFTAT